MATEIFELDLSDCAPAVLRLEPFISPERRARAARARRESDRLLQLGAELCVAAAQGVPLPLSLCYEEGGRPFLPSHRPMSLSHSGTRVICALSQQAVGVDLEQISRMRPSVAGRYLSPEEQAATAPLQGAALQQALCRLWTRKEAYLKYTGEGLRRDPRSICVLSQIPAAQPSAVLTTLPPQQDFLISLATAHPDSIRRHSISVEELLQLLDLKG